MGFFRDTWRDLRVTGMSKGERSRYEAEEWERQGRWTSAGSCYEEAGDFGRAADCWMKAQWWRHAIKCSIKAGDYSRAAELYADVGLTKRGDGHTYAPPHVEARQVVKKLIEAGQLESVKRRLRAHRTDRRQLGELLWRKYMELKDVFEHLNEYNLAAEICELEAEDYPDWPVGDNRRMCLTQAKEYRAKGAR